MARNSSRAFRKTAALAIARDNGICGICGHGGARTADHIIPHHAWPKDENGRPLPGLDNIENLRAAHGSRGPAEHNPCYQCQPQGRMCNQTRGARHTKQPHPEPHSKSW